MRIENAFSPNKGGTPSRHTAVVRGFCALLRARSGLRAPEDGGHATRHAGVFAQYALRASTCEDLGAMNAHRAAKRALFTARSALLVSARTLVATNDALRVSRSGLLVKKNALRATTSALLTTTSAPHATTSAHRGSEPVMADPQDTETHV
jgi:hypothetical protein